VMVSQVFFRRHVELLVIIERVDDCRLFCVCCGGERRRVAGRGGRVFVSWLPGGGVGGWPLLTCNVGGRGGVGFIGVSSALLLVLVLLGGGLEDQYLVLAVE